MLRSRSRPTDLSTQSLKDIELGDTKTVVRNPPRSNTLIYRSLIIFCLVLLLIWRYHQETYELLFRETEDLLQSNPTHDPLALSEHTNTRVNSASGAQYNLEWPPVVTQGLEDARVVETNIWQWPPLVTVVPDDPLMQAESLSPLSRYLGRKYILPLRIGEQESKARIHMAQILTLAGLLNRTVILPYVGSSRIGLCRPLDFHEYYDRSSLGDKVISLDAFKSLSVRLGKKGALSGQVVAILPRPPPSSQMEFVSDGAVFSKHNWTELEPAITTCVSNQVPWVTMERSFATMVYPSDSTRAKIPKSSSQHETYGHALAKGIQRSFVQLSPDVLIFDYNLRHPIFSKADDLMYSPKVLNLASALAPSSWYLAIHWRMESVPKDNLAQCAHSLVALLSRMLEEDAVASVWIASDAPLTGADAKSGTFSQFGPEHREAIGILLGAFRPSGMLESWTGQVTYLEEALNSAGEFVSDTGILGILDKAVLMEATLFVSGAKGCGRESSYTRQIISERRRNVHQARHRNVVDLFSIVD